VTALFDNSLILEGIVLAGDAKSWYDQMHSK